jgi:hypothetical protein
VEEVQGGLTLENLYPKEANTCRLAELGECDGGIEYGICEEHAKQIFKIAWR